jgi:hypothetical protein
MVFGPAIGGRPALPPGVPLLLIAAVACLVLPGRVGGGIALVVIGCLVAVSVGPLGADLTGGRGPWLVAARVVEIGGLAVAGYAGVRRLIEAPSRGRTWRAGWTRQVQIFGLFGLCAIGAELLSAYGDSTGDPGQVVFAVIFFGALYGAPALLARELVRRRGWGWPSMLLLFVALGIAQACLIDQSLFSADYQGYEGWQEGRAATFIPVLGISALSADNFVVGHLIFSFAAPVALAESWAPQRAREPWLGRAGTVVTAIAYLCAAVLVLTDPESHSASPLQLSVSIGLVLAAIAAAVFVGRAGDHDAAGPRSGGPPLVPVLVISMILELIAAFAGEGWLALLLGVVTTGGVGAGIVLAGRRWGWSVRHSAAVGLAFLLVRGGLAFTYFPLIGDVEPVPKYLHNVVMIVVVIIAGAFALRRPADRSMPGRRPARSPAQPAVSRPGGRTDRGAARSRRRGGSPHD